MSRVLVASLLLAACGAPAVRPAPMLAHTHEPASTPVAAAPAIPPVSAEAERPSWLEPAQPSRHVVTSTSITILDPIAFLGSSARIDPVSYPMLEMIVATLDGNPSIRVMEVVISGRDAPERWQQELGDRRARMVVDYLIHRGADRSRLRARGAPKATEISSFVILQRD